MPGQWAHDYREKADHYTTKIGGLPDWPELDVAVSGDLLLCGLCGGKLCLVAQIYAPLSIAKGSIDERVIYVLGCMSWIVAKTPEFGGFLEFKSTNRVFKLKMNHLKKCNQKKNLLL